MLFILAEKRKQKDAYVRALKGHVRHLNRYLDEVDDSTIRPDKPKILLSFLQGHAYELVDAKDYNSQWRNWALKYLPIFPSVFKHRLSPSFIKTSGGRYHMRILNDAVDKCDEMWLGSDPDVEGEGLIYEPIDINNWRRKIKITGRIWLNHGLLPNGLAKTFKHDILNPEKTKPRATASHAREIADWLIGINISRLITDIAQSHGYRGVFTAGRVQTPTLALITARRHQREIFKPVTTYRLAFRDKNGLNFLGNLKDKDGKSQKASFKTPAGVAQIAKVLGKTPLTTNVQNQTRHQSAPKLPKTNDMQGYLVTHAHMSAKDAANKVLEPMYDRYNLQTYPRTECNLITIDDFQAIKAKLPQYRKLYEQIIQHPLPKELFTNLEPRKKYVDFTGKKVQKQGHGAITVDPENKVMSLAQFKKMSFADRVDYEYVLGSTLAMFADDHSYQELKIDAKSGKFDFSASNKSDLPNATDWKQLFPEASKKKKSSSKVPANDYATGERLTPDEKRKATNGYYAKSETTTPPTAITEANLVRKVMPKFNLGTSSTRGSIIDGLKHTKLIVSSKKKVASKNLKRREFMPTNKGIICLELLRYSHLMNLAKVSSWENQMKSITQKKLTYDTFIKGIKTDIADDVEKMPHHDYKFSIKPKPKKASFKNIKKRMTDVTCPKCKRGKLQLLTMDMSSHGSDYFHIGFYGCSHRSCHFSASANLSGLKVTPEVLRKIINGTLPPQHLKSKGGNPFTAKLVYYRGKIRYKFPSRFKKIFNIKCPKCKRGHIGFISGTVKRGKNRGKPYALYACTKCKFIQFQTVAKVKLTPQMIKEAIDGKMPWTQFTKKNGDPMIAKLYYHRGKLKMKFKN